MSRPASKSLRAGSAAIQRALRPLIVLVICLGTMPRAVAAGAIVVTEATFSVVHVNRSKAPCATDEATYRVRGTLALPGSDPHGAISLYLHGGTAGRWVWNLEAVPQYDFVAGMADRGHASLALDMIGYDDSRGETGPNGFAWCFGSSADVVAQVVALLRTGDYALANGMTPPRFGRVALVGHSGGGITAEVAAYSFGADALVLIGWVDHPATLAIAGHRTYSDPDAGVHDCARGGERAEDDGTGPPGYAYTWATAEQEIEDAFYDVEPAVVRAFRPIINRDPCGYTATIGETILRNNVHGRSISSPILLVAGEHDFVTPDEVEIQRQRFTESDDVSSVVVADAGHTLMLERQAPVFRRVLSGWLARRGF